MQQWLSCSKPNNQRHSARLHHDPRVYWSLSSQPKRSIVDRLSSCCQLTAHPSQSLIKAETPRAQLVQMACDAEDKYRSSVFCRTFVAGHKHPLWANTMDNIRYRFQDDALKQAAKDFQQQLLVTEQQLQRQGIHICPLAHTFQSICWWWLTPQSATCSHQNKNARSNNCGRFTVIVYCRLSA